MSDDRDWSKDRTGCISFQEYVKRVVNAGTKRSDELDSLTKLFGISTLEKVLSGGTISEKGERK